MSECGRARGGGGDCGTSGDNLSSAWSDFCLIVLFER